ncbi:MAG: right-handed parallel beta-helix repeat-containing protein [Candidatus Woesearchaeota archaeon]
MNKKRLGFIVVLLVLLATSVYAGTVIVNTVLRANQIRANQYCDINGENCVDSLSGGSGNQCSSRSVTVGLTGDYQTINSALNSLTSCTINYPQNLAYSTITLLEDYVMQEQVIVDGQNLGWIRIEGVSPKTIVQGSSITISVRGGRTVFAAVDGGFLPIIDQLFELDSSSEDDIRGILAAGPASGARIASGAGFNNATVGILAKNGGTIFAEGAFAQNSKVIGFGASQGSTLIANDANAHGSGRGINAVHSSSVSAINATVTNSIHGVYASHGSTITAQGVDARNAQLNGFTATRGSTVIAHHARANNAGSGGFVASQNSAIYALNSSALNSGEYGYFATISSTIDARNSSARYSHRPIIVSQGSTVSARYFDGRNADLDGIYVRDSSSADVRNSQFQSAERYGIRAYGSSNIQAEDSNVRYASSGGVRAEQVSIINAQDVDARNSGGRGIFAAHGSTINAHRADARNSAEEGMYAAYGSTINAHNSQSSGTNAYRVNSGSTINAVETTGTVLPSSVNTLSREGIIYR